MPSRAEIVLFDDSPPPPGASAWLPDAPRAAGHVGSTSVPGLPAKPIIDIDLTVADPGREQDYVPALETPGPGWRSASPGGTATGLCGRTSLPATCTSSGSTAPSQ